jgi:hypothetical protein
VKGGLSVKKEEQQMDHQLSDIDEGEDICSQWDDSVSVRNPSYSLSLLKIRIHFSHIFINSHYSKYRRL